MIEVSSSTKHDKMNMMTQRSTTHRIAMLKPLAPQAKQVARDLVVNVTCDLQLLLRD
jgi:hypothetical protein